MFGEVCHENGTEKYRVSQCDQTVRQIFGLEQVRRSNCMLKTARLALRLFLLEMESETRVQILDETACVSFFSNALGKCMNSSLLSAIGK